MQTFKIRQSIPEDSSRLFQLWLASVQATHHFLTEEDVDSISLEVEAYVKNCSFVVAVDAADVPLAFMGMTDNKIDSLFVDPSSFGVGIGKALIDFVRPQFQELHVDVNEANEQARGFYNKLGFIVFERSEWDDAGRPLPLLRMKCPSL